MTPNVPGPDPIEQAAATLLRAAELMERTERQNADRARDAANAGWAMLAQRAGQYDRARQLSGQEALYRTPSGQQLLGQQLQADSNERLARQRLELAQQRAELARVNTPQGQADTLQGARLAAQQQEAQQQVRAAQQRAREQVAREQNIAQYGRLGVAIGDAGKALGMMRDMTGAAVGVIGRIVSLPLRLAAQASPNSAGTLEASWGTLQARAGTMFVPAMEALSKNVQRFSDDVKDFRQSRAGAAVTGAATFITDTSTRNPLPGAQAPTLGATLGRNLFSALSGMSAEQIDLNWRAQRRAMEADTGPGGWHARSWLGQLVLGTASRTLDTSAPDRSFAGLHQPRMGTGESYYRETQMEVLAAGPEDLKKLNEQLENLARIMGPLLEKIADNTARSPEVNSFR